MMHDVAPGDMDRSVDGMDIDPLVVPPVGMQPVTAGAAAQHEHDVHGMMYIMHTRVPTKSIKNNLVHNESENGTRGTKN